MNCSCKEENSFLPRSQAGAASPHSLPHVGDADFSPASHSGILEGVRKALTLDLRVGDKMEDGSK